MDGRFSQYCGFISAQSRANKDATDVVESLEEATKGKDRIVTDYWFALTVNISVTDSVTQYLILFLSPFSLCHLSLYQSLYVLFFSLFHSVSLSILFPLVPFSGLLEVFMSRNKGQMPKQIIIYRDGVSDSQFQSILESELPSIQGMYVSD